METTLGSGADIQQDTQTPVRLDFCACVLNPYFLRSKALLLVSGNLSACFSGLPVFLPSSVYLCCMLVWLLHIRLSCLRLSRFWVFDDGALV